MKVLHVVTALGLGGAEKVVQAHCLNSRHQTQVATCYAGGGVADALIAEGVPVHALQSSGRHPRLDVILGLVRLLRREHFDVVHVHLLTGQLLGIPAARLARTPVVVSTEHSLMDDQMEGRPLSLGLRTLYRLLERGTDATIAVSTATAHRLARLGVPPRRTVVVAVPLDTSGLGPDAAAREQVRADLGIDPDEVVLGAIGRLAPVKRLDVLIEAAVPLLTSGGHLVLLGSGPLEDMLREQARLLGVASQVHFLGLRSDVPRVLASMDVFASPSRDETFGMAVVEAAITGLPVIYGSCPGMDVPMVSSPAWRELPPVASREEEVAALRRALEEAVSGPAPDPVAVRALDQHYNAHRLVSTVDDLYERLLGRRRRVMPRVRRPRTAPAQ